MEPDRQPMLEGETVSLRPTRADDWAALYAAARDPLIWAGHPASDRWQEPAFRRYFDDGLASGGMLTIRDKASGAVIGSSRYHSWQPEAGQIEIGWTFLVRSRWGGGTNGEVKRLMLDHIHAFVPTVVFTIGRDNVRSRRAIEKIGGVLRPGSEIRVMAGRDVPHVVYEIRRAA